MGFSHGFAHSRDLPRGTVYQELLEFTRLDLAQGDSDMASRAREAWKDYGIAEDEEIHYCLIRLVGLPVMGGVLCTFDLLPYGESIFTETISVYSEKPGLVDTVTNILGAIAVMFGESYVNKLFPYTATRITERATSVERIVSK